MASEKQISFIMSLTKRLLKAKVSDKEGQARMEAHLNWGINNSASMTKKEASEWIDHLRQMVVTTNSVIARYSVNGIGSQI